MLSIKRQKSIKLKKEQDKPHLEKDDASRQQNKLDKVGQKQHDKVNFLLTKSLMKIDFASKMIRVNLWRLKWGKNNASAHSIYGDANNGFSFEVNRIRAGTSFAPVLLVLR